MQALQERQVDVVLLDMNLPDRHGLEVIRAMRAGGHQADVIALTSARDLEVVRAAVSLGVVQYVLKPFVFATLRERLLAYRAYREQVQGAEQVGTQAEVDEVIGGLRAAAEARLPKGMGEELLSRVSRALREADRGRLGDRARRGRRGEPGDGQAVRRVPLREQACGAALALRRRRPARGGVPVVGMSRLGRGGPALDDAAAAIARAYDLDGRATLTGPVDRGELGEIWRLETGQGRYAVKVPFEPVDPAELREPAAFAGAVADAGVATPRVLRAQDGSVVETVAGQQVVLLEWLDLLPPSTALDPAGVGGLLAGIHRVPFDGARPPSAWFSTPVGEARWRDLVTVTRLEGAPFAEHLADYVDALVALEALLDPLPADRTCHRDLWADNVRGLRGGGLCVFDWDACGPGSQSEELGLRAVRVRARGPRAAPGHPRRLQRRGRAGPRHQPAGLLDAHRPPRPHRGVPDQAVARGPAGIRRAGSGGRRGGGVRGPAAVSPPRHRHPRGDPRRRHLGAVR